MDISKLIVQHADIIEQVVEYAFVGYVGGNILPSKKVKKWTQHFPLSDLITDYFKKDKKKQ